MANILKHIEKVAIPSVKRHYSSISEWKSVGIELFGPDKRDWKFICPVCGRVQSYWDFKAGYLSYETTILHVYFSCLSRFRNVAGTLLGHLPECGYSSTDSNSCGDTISIIHNGQEGIIPVLPFAPNPTDDT